MTTQFARASYQEIIDLHTESDKVSVIGIHTPTSDTPRKMFGGFFNQFKKFKYLGCSISLVPAARLPADPLQVSYEAGEPTIDPRDMLNPIMFHGCHGNDMGAILNRLYALNTLASSPDAKLSDSIFQVESSTGAISDLEHFSFGEQLENLYYKALTDNTWKKAHPQRGFRKSGLRPMVYSMATNMQFNGSSIEMEGFGVPSPINDFESFTQNTLNDMKRITVPVTQDGRRFFTPRLIGLGWLDTRNVLTLEKYAEAPANTSVTAMLDGIAELQTQEMEASLPLVYMGMILMPPAYKTEQYYRMIVNHHFAFKDFRGISFMPGSGIMADDGASISPAYANFNDDDYEYDGPTGGEVDPPNPDDPDDPGEGGDDGTLLTDKISSGILNFDSRYWNVYEHLTVDDVEYSTSIVDNNYHQVAGLTKGFIVAQDNGDVPETANIGYIIMGESYSTKIDNNYGVSAVAYIDGTFWVRSSVDGSWSDGGISHQGDFIWSVSPANADLSAQVGSNTAFTDVSEGA